MMTGALPRLTTGWLRAIQSEGDGGNVKVYATQRSRESATRCECRLAVPCGPSLHSCCKPKRG